MLLVICRFAFYVHLFLLYFIATHFFILHSLSLFSVYPLETKCNLSTIFRSDIGCVLINIIVNVD